MFFFNRYLIPITIIVISIWVKEGIADDGMYEFTDIEWLHLARLDL